MRVLGSEQAMLCLGHLLLLPSPCRHGIDLLARNGIMVHHTKLTLPCPEARKFGGWSVAGFAHLTAWMVTERTSEEQQSGQGLLVEHVGLWVTLKQICKVRIQDEDALGLAEKTGGQ